MDIALNIKKASVYDDVAKLTGYIGAKNNESELTYDKVFTTDDDRILLERFWRDSCNASTDEFKNFIKSVTENTSQTIDNTEIYTVVMDMPSSFDSNLTNSIQNSLHSYFVNSIASKWFALIDKNESEYYKAESLGNGNDIRRKIYFRKKPIRVTPV